MSGEAAARAPVSGTGRGRRPVEASRLARLRGTALVLPGVAWLALFFVVPLAIIFIVSLGHRDALDRVDLSQPELRELRPGVRSGLPADVRPLDPVCR